MNKFLPQPCGVNRVSFVFQDLIESLILSISLIYYENIGKVEEGWLCTIFIRVTFFYSLDDLFKSAVHFNLN